MSEGPLKSIDFLYFFEDNFPEISVDEQIKIRNLSIDLSALARSLGEEEVAIEFEQTMRYWVAITRTITEMKRVVNSKIARGDRWDRQCSDFQQLRESKALTAITKMYLSEVDKTKFDSFTGQSALYARYMDVKAALDDVLRVYKQKRTKFQAVKNTVGGVEGKVNALQTFLSRIYKSILESLLRFLALSTCSPPSLQRGEPLFFYSSELNANYKRSIKPPKQIQQSKVRNSFPSSRETSHGYVPGRGFLMVHKNTGAYRYSPSTNEDTGGVPTSEEVQAFFAERNAGRRALASGDISLSPIAENQDGGRRRKKRQTRAQRKGTRRR